MSSPYPPSFRLAAPAGVLIDRSRTIQFRFAGEEMEALAGDTIASALIANGRWLMSRSFKYHRPRGPASLAGCEANTLVQVGDEPNVLADLRAVQDGDDVQPLNVRAGVDHDRLAILGAFSRFLPVGFYYRDFYGRRWTWDRWEPRIRAMAGLGRIASQGRAHGLAQRFVHCDVAVVGGGPAGLAFAAEASRHGADVAVFEQLPRLGGSLLWGRLRADSLLDATDRALRLGQLELPSDVRTFVCASVTGVFEDGLLSVVTQDELLKVRARRIVMAQGGYEQLPVFPENDLPGLALPSGLLRLMRLYGVRPGRQAVVLAADDAAYGAAVDLLDAGVEVAALVDLRGSISGPDDCIEVLERQGTRLLDRPSHVRGIARRGRRHLDALEVRMAAGETLRFACDVAAISAGTIPAYGLAGQGGARVRYEEACRNFVVEAPSGTLDLVGTMAGISELDDAIQHAQERAARAWGARSSAASSVDACRHSPQALAAWPLFEGAGKAFIDLDEDLQPADLRESIALGYSDMQLLKRFSTVGMGPSQGRHSSLATLRVLAQASGAATASTGIATPRPPAGEETVAHFAGWAHGPFRRTALHAAHLAAGATMMAVGDWQRPAFFGSPANREQAIASEVEAVRTRAGVFDVGTLGGLLVRGVDAASFLERIYCGRYLSMKPGGVRYALMLDETGAVYDDGLIARVEQDVFYVTTTTGHSDAIYRLLLRWNAQWSLDVDVTNVTTAYCGLNLAGPASRAILEQLCAEDDISQAAFGYMKNRTLRIAGVRALVMRVGFLGELGFEMHLPSRHAAAVLERILHAGAAHGLAPVGVEAQRLLRLEKGHIIVGQDSDAIATPHELGLGALVAMDKPFFLGQRALRVHLAKTASRALIGWAGPPGARSSVAEGHLVVDGQDLLGHVTSVGYSAALGRTIGMAIVSPKSAQPGSRITLRGEGGELFGAEVATAPFYDPQGARQKL